MELLWDPVGAQWQREEAQSKRQDNHQHCVAVAGAPQRITDRHLEHAP